MPIIFDYFPFLLRLSGRFCFLRLDLREIESKPYNLMTPYDTLKRGEKMKAEERFLATGE